MEDGRSVGKGCGMGKREEGKGKGERGKGKGEGGRRECGLRNPGIGAMLVSLLVLYG